MATRPRSSTSAGVVISKQELNVDAACESDSDGEDRPTCMVRKKSGELVRPVLRSASSNKRRPSSVPGTPHASKAVHFDAHLEHIRHFLRVDKPVAVSAETTPEDEHRDRDSFPFHDDDDGDDDDDDGPSSMERELRLPNFPRSTPARLEWPVRLERLYLSSDKNTLVGVVSVANLSFQKLVVARFTFDNWKTVSEVAADYSADVRRKQSHDGHDRFVFSVKLSDQTNLEKKTMYVCIRYNFNGQEYWDNNGGGNYHVDFVKVPRSKAIDHLPTSRRSSSGSPRPTVERHNSLPSALYDPGFATFDQYMASRRTTMLNKKEEVPRPRGKMDKEDDVPKCRDSRQPPFGNRYDFGASLSAAMRTRPSEDRTTLTAKARSEDESKGSAQRGEPEERGRSRHANGFRVGSTQPTTSVSRQGVHSHQMTSLSGMTGKPDLENSVYKELVEKYCFVCDICFMN